MQGPGCVTEMAACRKEAVYATLQTQFDFQPIAVDTLGSINESVTYFYRTTRKRGLCCRPESACVSVTSVYCIQMAEDIVKLPHRRYPVPRVPSAVAQNKKVGKILRFSTEIAVYLGSGTR